MSSKTALYAYVFDDVQFAIDLKESRRRFNLTQPDVAEAIGYKYATAYGMIENAKYSKSLSMTVFMSLCQFFDLNPMDYFDLETREQNDIARFPFASDEYPKMS